MKEIAKFLKLMILTSISGGFAFIGYTFYAGYEDGRIFAAEPPPPPPTAHELALAAFDAQLWLFFRWTLLALLLACLALVIVRFLYVPALNARERIPYDPATGLAPVIRRNVAPWWKRLTGHNEYDEFDPNLATAPHRKIWSNGRMVVAAESDGLDPHAQADYARGSWGVQGSIARKGRGLSVGESRLLSGEAAARAELQRMKVSAAKAKLGDAPAQDTPLLPPPPPLSFREAIEQSTPTSWILGQGAEQQPATPQAVGKLLAYDPRSSHIALIGATRTGKTSNTGLMVVMLARRHGLHPIVFDGKGGLDWGPLDGVVEWHNMTESNLGAYIDSLVQVYDKRYQKLIQLGKGHIYQLPAERRPVPIFAMFEEFGEHFTALGKAERMAVGKQMNTLFRLGQAAGITLCLIDQAPEKWTQQMRGNSKFVVCYKLKGGVANAFNEYHADQLPDRGVFSQDNTFYKAWHTEVEAPNLAGMFPPISRRMLPVIDGPTNGPARPAGPKVNPALKGVAPVVGPPGPVGPLDPNGGGEGRKTLNIPPSLRVQFERTRTWDDFCRGFLEIYPEATAADLKRAMADVDGRGRDHRAFNGEGNRQWNRYSPNGDKDKATR